MLSVVLATHNEAKNLRRCLDSVQELAGEIVVVDGESTDETVAIAQDYAARVIRTTNKLNFHINKQMAIDAARGELILQLDADEVLDDELQESIKQVHDLLLQGAAELTENAWWLKRKNFFLGVFLKKGGQYPDPVIRLFRSGKASLPMRSVHEQMNVDGTTATLKGHLLHYSNPTFAEYLRKWNTYTSFTAQQWFDQARTVSVAGGFRYSVFEPIKTFFSLYIRHRGYVDGLAGLVFAIMSALHHPFAYLKLWELHEVQRKIG
jgi:glycosyltransferase involved in cell wall biosynthesis